MHNLRIIICLFTFSILTKIKVVIGSTAFPKCSFTVWQPKPRANASTGAGFNCFCERGRVVGCDLRGVAAAVDVSVSESDGGLCLEREEECCVEGVHIGQTLLCLRQVSLSIVQSPPKHSEC